MYGYNNQDDRESQGSMNFGLNAGSARLTKFQYIPNGGAGGAEQDALEIVFNIGGKEVSYRKFPVVKAFEDKEEITDPQHPAFIKAVDDFNAVMTHIMHSFVDDETLQAAFKNKIESFKEYADVLTSLLPKNYSEIPLDIFMQYPWNEDNNGKKYLQLPKDMRQGRWLTRAIEPVGGPWKEVRSTVSGDAKALTYVDGAGNVHPFTKSQWFLDNPYSQPAQSANKQQSASTGNINQTATTPPKTGGSW